MIDDDDNDNKSDTKENMSEVTSVNSTSFMMKKHSLYSKEKDDLINLKLLNWFNSVYKPPKYNPIKKAF